MHPLNPYSNAKPDFAVLAAKYPSFAPFVTTSETGYANVDFQDPKALRQLTEVLLKEDWGLEVELRDDRLCPTLANRLDYILHILDLEPYCTDSDTWIEPRLRFFINGEPRTRFLDIGTGHVAIYPLLLHKLRPSATIYGTEINDISLDHALDTLTRNSIDTDRVQLIRTDADQPILRHLTESKVDVVVCNPPFFGSEEEMQEGKDLKMGVAHAAPTAAKNELITAGGEIAFVSQMISESLNHKDRAKWYTSLIGKYASLQPLVELLRTRKIDNYFVKSIRQAQTARWIVGWSFMDNRIPDSLTRPENLIPGTTFAKLLPRPNRLEHTPEQPLSVEQLREKVLDVLSEIQLSVDSGNIKVDESGGIILCPRANTWSRAARRQAARYQSTSQADRGPLSSQEKPAPIMIIRLFFTPPPAQSHVRQDTFHTKPEEEETVAGEAEATEVVGTAYGQEAGPGASLILDFLKGRDRDLFDGFWKFLLTKAGLLGHNTTEQSGVKRSITAENREDTGRAYSSSYAQTGDFRGGKDRGQGRGRGKSKGRGSGQDSGWAGRGRAGY